MTKQSDSVLIVGGGKDDGRWLCHAAEMRGQFQAVHAGHADVQQRDVQRCLLGQFQRLPAGTGLVDVMPGIQL